MMMILVIVPPIVIVPACSAGKKRLLLLPHLVPHLLPHHRHQQPLATIGPHHDDHLPHPGHGHLQHGEGAASAG